MRITTFRHSGGVGWGLVEDDGVIDLSLDPSLPYADASEALATETVLDLAMSACGVRPSHHIDDVEPLAPLPAPGTVLMVRPGGTVELDSVAMHPHAEHVEGNRVLAVVVGSPTAAVTRERAVEHLLGAMPAVLDRGRLHAGPWLHSRDETGDLDLLHAAGGVLADIVAEASAQWTLRSGDLILLPAVPAGPADVVTTL